MVSIRDAAEARWLQRRDVVGVEPVLTDVDRMRLALSSSRVLRQNVRKAKATRSRVRTAASRATRELSDEQSRAVKPYVPLPEKEERFVEGRPVGWSTSAWFTGGQ